jgi:hypothetical protein
MRLAQGIAYEPLVNGVNDGISECSRFGIRVSQWYLSGDSDDAFSCGCHMPHRASRVAVKRTPPLSTLGICRNWRLEGKLRLNSPGLHMRPPYAMI